jgi:anti-sigma factor RsiW
MVCIECQDLLSAFIDGDLPERRRTAIEAHLRACPPCQALCNDLAQIVEASSQLPLHTPSPSLWSRIEREISLGVARPTWWGRLASRRFDFSITAQQVVAGAAAVVLCAGVLGTIRYTSPGSLPSVAVNWDTLGGGSAAGLQAQALAHTLRPDDLAAFRASVAEMQGGVERQQAQWSPELRSAFSRGLAAADATIAERERSLQAAPADGASRERLLAAYRDKLLFLDEFTHIGN